MPDTNQLFDNMLRAAKERLADHDPLEIAKNACVEFTGDSFRLMSFGRKVCISFPDFDISPELPQWHTLSLLHYLDLADGFPAGNKQMPFAAYRDGMVRGGGFDRDAEKFIENKLGHLDEALLAQRCLALGGALIPSNADLCARFDFAPCYPLWLKIWFADDEFPASGRLFVSETADHYLTIEDAVTVGSVLFDLLADANISV